MPRQGREGGGGRGRQGTGRAYQIEHMIKGGWVPTDANDPQGDTETLHMVDPAHGNIVFC